MFRAGEIFTEHKYSTVWTANYNVSAMQTLLQHTLLNFSAEIW